MVCGPVQVVWHKFAKYWDIEMREVPMRPGHYAMDAADMLERVDENDGDISRVTSADYRRIVDLCWQCKLCFNHCPYTPPTASTSTSRD